MNCEHDAHGVRMSTAEVDEGAEKRGRRQVLEPREVAAGHLPDAQGQEEEGAEPNDDEPDELHPAPTPVEVTHAGSVCAPRCARIGAGPDRAYGFSLNRPRSGTSPRDPPRRAGPPLLFEGFLREYEADGLAQRWRRRV